MWFYIPKPSTPPRSTFCLCVRVEVASTSVCTLLYEISLSDLERSCTWRGKSTLRESWRRAWQKAPWMTRLSGLTSDPLTLDAGLTEHICSLVDSLANRPASLALALAAPTIDGSGPTSRGSSTSAGPPSCSWRTSPVFFLSMLEKVSKRSSRIWPRSGSMRSGVVTARPTFSRPTRGRGSSSWPTPDVAVSTQTNRGGSNGRVGPERPLLAKLVRDWRPGQGSHWPTTAQDSERSGRHSGTTLTDAAVRIANWATPRAEERQQYNSQDQYEALSLQVTKWATPTTRDWKDGACEDANVSTNGLLGRQAVRSSWLTPTTTDMNGPGHARDGAPDLRTVASHHGLQDQTMSTGGETTSPTIPTLRPPRRLNPNFVEALMGWPQGWSIPYTRAEVDRVREASREPVTPSGPID